MWEEKINKLTSFKSSPSPGFYILTPCFIVISRREAFIGFNAFHFEIC